MERGKHLEPKAAVKTSADPGWSFNIQHSVQIKQSLDGVQPSRWHPRQRFPIRSHKFLGKWSLRHLLGGRTSLCSLPWLNISQSGWTADCWPYLDTQAPLLWGHSYIGCLYQAPMESSCRWAQGHTPGVTLEVALVMGTFIVGQRKRIPRTHVHLCNETLVITDENSGYLLSTDDAW